MTEPIAFSTTGFALGSFIFLATISATFSGGFFLMNCMPRSVALTRPATIWGLSFTMFGWAMKIRLSAFWMGGFWAM